MGGVELFGATSEARGPRGLFIARNGLQGIDDGVGVRREAIEIPGGHGEFDLPVKRGPRAITLTGVAAAKTLFDLGRLRADFTGVGADGALFRIEVEHQTETVWMNGRLAAAPVFRDRGSAGDPFLADFEMQIICPDPRKFGTIRTTAQGQAAVNYGNFPATPMLYARRVSGSGGYTISTDAGEIAVSAALSVGSTHRIDLGTGSVYSGSTRLTGAISRFQPWSVPPGAALLHTASAGINLTVETADTWV